MHRHALIGMTEVHNIYIFNPMKFIRFQEIHTIFLLLLSRDTTIWAAYNATGCLRLFSNVLNICKKIPVYFAI